MLNMQGDNIKPWHTPFLIWNQSIVPCPDTSNCCFLTCIQISQEAGQVVCYFYLLKNFPQFVVIQTVKGFEVVNKAWEFQKNIYFCFIYYAKAFPSLEPVRCSMPNSNCCFLTYIHISQEAGKVVWCSHLLKNFPQFVVIHTVKGFGVVSKAK